MTMGVRGDSLKNRAEIVAERTDKPVSLVLHIVEEYERLRDEIIEAAVAKETADVRR